MDTDSTVAAIWHVVFTALKWSVIWAAATNLFGKLAMIHPVMTH